MVIEQVSQAVTLAISILQVIGSNFSEDAGYRGRVSWFSSVPQKKMPVYYFISSHHCFLPYRLQLIFPESS
jgi:hypothetical protein